MTHGLARRYFALLGLGVVAWWTWLGVAPTGWPYFLVHDAPPITLGAFAPGDLGLVALGALLVAWRPQRRWSAPLAWAVTGAMGYAASYTLVTAVLSAAAPFGAVCMVPGAIGCVVAARSIAQSSTQPGAQPGAQDHAPHESASPDRSR